MLVFEAGKELYQLDHEPVGRARSKWEGAQLQVTIFRKDYDDVDGLHWANFDADREVAKKLDLPERRGWQKDFHYQLEVDYKLRFRIYLCCGEPHYMVSPDVPSLDVRRLWSTMSVAKSEEVGDLPARHSCYDQPHDQSSVTHDKTGDDWFDAQGKLGCTIAVDVFPGGGQPAIPGAETVLFKAGDELTEVFHTTADNDRQVKGLISKPLYEKAFRRDGSLDFYARRAEHESWQLLGSLRKPPPGSNFPKCYSVTLDAEGHLRLHMGLVPYWMTPTLEVLKSTPGYVYRQDMEANPPTLDEKRDPFAGIH